jgi:Glycogen recognition site of AMP-activated protein kinase
LISRARLFLLLSEVKQPSNDETGTVSLIDLLPGRHTYKFIVDGIWMTDPANPVDEDDGNGNINSVPVVKLQ